MIGRLLNSLFKSKEQKLIEAKALFVCDDLELPEDMRYKFLKKDLPQNMSFYMEKIKEDRDKLEGWMNLWVFNWMADLLEMGTGYAYRGVLSGEGMIYNEIMNKALKNAVKYQVISQEQADKNLRIVRKNMSEVG